jgi:hypothetical protein
VPVSGHIDAGNGTLRTSDILFVSASIPGDDGGLSREPVAIDLQN